VVEPGVEAVFVELCEWGCHGGESTGFGRVVNRVLVGSLEDCCKE
jgi:hypothetical protein